MTTSTPTRPATGLYREGESFALEMDAHDPLREFRSLFAIPEARAASAEAPAGESVYLTGNSLGCMPRAVPELIRQELEDWAKLGVEGHLHGRDPWLTYHEQFRGGLARLVGAREDEVVAMNSLTVNLHLLMTSFYRPTRERYAIMIEDSAFPSDSYAVASQASLHGFPVQDAIIRLAPREGETVLRTQDIIARIEREGARLALVMLGGVNYLTGQWFEMEAITRAARHVGAVCGWDLAHAAGNVPVRLHDWDVDFAAWCSYKYLNSGPGAIAGAFVHERHLGRQDLKQCAGWWGNAVKTRFRMGPDFEPVASADRWQLSNPPIFSLTPLKASLAIFDRAGMPRLREKSLLLTGYLEWLIDAINARRRGSRIGILTPRDSAQRGCQLSLVVPGDVKAGFAKLQRRGVICDFREPNVIRAAPTPLYGSFHDVWRFASVLEEVTA